MFVQWPGVLPGVCTVSLILFNPSFSLRFHHLRLSCSELLSILDPFNQWTVAHFNRKLRIFSNMFVTCATTQLPTFKPFLSSPTHDATLSHSTQYVCMCACAGILCSSYHGHVTNMVPTNERPLVVDEWCDSEQKRHSKNWKATFDTRQNNLLAVA